MNESDSIEKIDTKNLTDQTKLERRKEKTKD